MSVVDENVVTITNIKVSVYNYLKVSNRKVKMSPLAINYIMIPTFTYYIIL